jgi:hypothetical protein
MSIVFCVPQFKIGLELLQYFLHWKYKYISRFETSVHMTQGANMNHVHIKDLSSILNTLQMSHDTTHMKLVMFLVQL